MVQRSNQIQLGVTLSACRTTNGLTSQTLLRVSRTSGARVIFYKPASHDRFESTSCSGNYNQLGIMGIWQTWIITILKENQYKS